MVWDEMKLDLGVEILVTMTSVCISREDTLAWLADTMPITAEVYPAMVGLLAIDGRSP